MRCKIKYYLIFYGKASELVLEQDFKACVDGKTRKIKSLAQDLEGE